jgi:superfamily II DNA or RNA helicase
MRIEIRPSRIVIKDYTQPVSWLERSLSVWDPKIHSVTFQGFVTMERVGEPPELVVPGGVHFSDIKALRGLEVVDLRKAAAWKWKKIKAEMRNKPQDQVQVDSVNFLLGEGRFSQETQNYLVLATSKGKTFCSLNHIVRSGKLAVVFADQDHILDQWAREALKHTTMEAGDILVLKGTDRIRDLRRLGSDHPYKLILASHKTVSAFAAKEGYPSMASVLERAGVGIKVFDEAHTEWLNTLMLDLHCDVSETVYLSATPIRSNVSENKVYQEIYATVPKHGWETKYEEDEMYHTSILFGYDSQPSMEDIQSMRGPYGFDLNAWAQYMMRDDKFYPFFEKSKKIFDSLYKTYPNAQMAIFLHKDALLEKAAEHLRELYPEKNVTIFYGKVKGKKREEAMKGDIMVTNLQIFQKAVDIETLEVVYNPVPIRSQMTTEQAMGRLRGKNGRKAFYIDGTDMGFKQCKDMRSSRKQIIYAKSKLVKQLDL